MHLWKCISEWWNSHLCLYISGIVLLIMWIKTFHWSIAQTNMNSKYGPIRDLCELQFLKTLNISCLVNGTRCLIWLGHICIGLLYPSVPLICEEMWSLGSTFPRWRPDSRKCSYLAGSRILVSCRGCGSTARRTAYAFYFLPAFGTLNEK